ncbi:hypothetical protein [Sphingobacterium litopenaei]|uniref:Glycosyltransferase n=1 Tax=Sphingobacterium litopenaei TaxID=2763500 RepID=A0ABR7YH58_9SPHI|nr:hypothetical protein [Sphingobacterium litopenaei]MBD1430543.1 hypothetical protein [Sphingobacterium litopenaei]
MILTSKYGLKEESRTSIKRFQSELDLAHIRRLTDTVGIVQHAKFATPDYNHGYCIDDNSRALMLAGLANKIQPHSCDALIDTYLAYIHYMQRENGMFGNFLSFDHRFLDDYGTEDAFGRTIWSLGSLMYNDNRPHIQQLLKEIVDRAYPHISELRSIRANAYALCGLVYMLKSKKYQKDLIKEIYLLADFISNEYEKASSDGWQWYEEVISYDNAIIPYSLMLTKDILFEEKYLTYAIDSATFLDEIIFKENTVELIGNAGWLKKNGEKASAGEQAIEIPSLILMYQKLAEINNAPKFHYKAKCCFSWFHGTNRLQAELFDPFTKGCKDGLDKNTINQNQGAESTISYWLAYIYQHYEIY